MDIQLRKPEYLSPSAIALYERSPEEYLHRYLGPNKPPRDPQTQPMAIGSAFDAYVKAYLYERFVNKGDAKYAFQAMFESQVEPQWRDWALKEGSFVFRYYQKTGSMADLILELQNHVAEPKFETDILGTVDGRRQIMAFAAGAVRNRDIQAALKHPPVSLLGKPDMYFIAQTGDRIILDWKVNGYCSNSNTSPLKGYVRLYELGQSVKIHPEAVVETVGGIRCNRAMYLEDVKRDWARQISIYAWLLGTPVGGRIIAAIDQICGQPHNLRVANHRLLIRPETQFEYYVQAADLWHRVSTGHFYTEFTRAESDARIEQLLTPKPPQDQLDDLIGDLQKPRWVK